MLIYTNYLKKLSVFRTMIKQARSIAARALDPQRKALAAVVTRAN